MKFLFFPEKSGFSSSYVNAILSTCIMHTSAVGEEAGPAAKPKSSHRPGGMP
jgi:hypothetical protein